MCIGTHRRVSPLSLHTLSYVWVTLNLDKYLQDLNLIPYIRGTTSTFVLAIMRRRRMYIYNVASLYIYGFDPGFSILIEYAFSHLRRRLLWWSRT